LAGLVQRAALDFLWGGGWQELVLERGAASNATAGNVTSGGVAGLTLKPAAFPQNRALNARFAGGLFAHPVPVNSSTPQVDVLMPLIAAPLLCHDRLDLTVPIARAMNYC